MIFKQRKNLWKLAILRKEISNLSSISDQKILTSYLIYFNFMLALMHESSLMLHRFIIGKVYKRSEN